MIPAKYNIVVPQGATFDTTITWTIDDAPVNLTGYTSNMQARESHKSSYETLTLNSYETSFDDTLSAIHLGGSSGAIRIYMTAAYTAALLPKTYVYDLEVSSDNKTYRMIEGTMTVTPEVTRV